MLMRNLESSDANTKNLFFFAHLLSSQGLMYIKAVAPHIYILLPFPLEKLIIFVY